MWHLMKHYQDLSDKKFFPGLIEYMTSGPVVAMVWEGKGVVSEGRKMLGATMPSESAPGTIRSDFCIEGKDSYQCFFSDNDTTCLGHLHAAG